MDKKLLKQALDYAIATSKCKLTEAALRELTDSLNFQEAVKQPLVYNNSNRSFETERSLQLLYADWIQQRDDDEEFLSYEKWLSGCYPNLIEVTEPDALTAAALMQHLDSDLKDRDELQANNDELWDKWYEGSAAVIYNGQVYQFGHGAQLYNALQDFCHLFINEQ